MTSGAVGGEQMVPPQIDLPEPGLTRELAELGGAQTRWMQVGVGQRARAAHRAAGVHS